MLRSALLLGAGIAAALVFACVPPPPGAPPPSAGVARAVPQACQSKGINSGDDFANRFVQVVNFDPQSMHGSLSLPGNYAAGTTYAPMLSLAFESAPTTFKGNLCGLNGVVINTFGCTVSGSGYDCSNASATNNSWALREKKQRNAAAGNRYIALSGALWTGGQPLNYRAYETMLLTLLSGWPGNNYSPLFQNSGDPDDTPQMTILAALAHEFGHILWYDTFDPDRSHANYDPNGFCPAIGGFFTKSWSGHVVAPPRWRKFAGVGQDQHSPAEVALVRDIAAAIRDGANGDWTTPSNDLYAIYAVPGSWPSLFATFSPDEDFVETFKLAVLLNAGTPLQHLPLQIPALGNTPPDVPATVGQRPDLTAKLSCFPVTP